MTTQEVAWMLRGDTPVWELTVLQYDGGPPFDLSQAAEIWFTAKRRKTDLDADAVFQLTLSGGQITIIDAAAGRADISPLTTSTSSLTTDTTVFWDVQIRTSASPAKTFTPIDGTLLIKLDVTRA